MRRWTAESRAGFGRGLGIGQRAAEDVVEPADGLPGRVDDREPRPGPRRVVGLGAVEARDGGAREVLAAGGRGVGGGGEEEGGDGGGGGAEGGWCGRLVGGGAGLGWRRGGNSWRGLPAVGVVQMLWLRGGRLVGGRSVGRSAYRGWQPREASYLIHPRYPTLPLFLHR